MSSPISSALEKLDGSLLALQSEVGCLKAGLEVSDDQLRQRLAEARQHATAVRDLIRAEQADAQWGDRKALDQLILDLESAAREKVNEQRRTRLLELAGEFEAGSIKHRFESRVSALNALREEAVAQLRADAALKDQEKVLPGPDAGEWLHWACNLQEDSDAATLDQLQKDFPAVAGFTGEMEESYWVAGTRSATVPISVSQPILPAAKESAPPAPSPAPAKPVQTTPAPAPTQPPAIEKVAAAAKQAKPSEPIIVPGRKPAQEPVLPAASKAAVATVATPQEKPAPPIAAQVAQPAPNAKAAEAPAKEPRPAVEPVRPSAPSKQWAAAAATAPAKETPEKKVVAAATVAAATVAAAPAAAPAATSTPRMKYCDKCGSTYPAQFNVCPIDSAPLRFTDEPAVTAARDSSAVVDKKTDGVARGAAVATAPQASSKSRAGAQPVQASHEVAKADFSEIRATLREHSEQEAVAEEHRGADWQALLRDKNWRALAANPMVLAAATLVAVLLVGGILYRAHRSHVSNDSVRAMEKAPDQPASNPQPDLSTPAAAATPTTVTPSTGTPSQGKPTEQNSAKQPTQTAQQQKPASDTQNQPKPTQVLSLPMPGTRDLATARKPEAPGNDTIEPPSSIPGALPNTSPNNLGAIAKDVPVAVPTLNQQKLRVTSGIAQAQLTHKVNPQYPPEAFQSRVHGTVVLQAQIGKDGAVKGVKVVSGPPMLIKAATEAVKQWRYKPFTLNGEPVEADTQINVNFSLGDQ